MEAEIEYDYKQTAEIKSVVMYCVSEGDIKRELRSRKLAISLRQSVLAERRGSTRAFQER